MYCPRCNLHSEEYGDKCPLCAGPMQPEPEEDTSGKTGLVSETKLPKDDLAKEESLIIAEEKLITQLEPEKEKIIAGETEGEKAWLKGEKEVSAAEDKVNPDIQLYQQKISSPSKKKRFVFSTLLGVVVLFILIGWVYYHFPPSKKTPFLHHPEVAPSKKTTTPPSPISPGQVKENLPSASNIIVDKPVETTIEKPVPPPVKESNPLPPKGETLSLEAKITPPEVVNRSKEVSLPTPDPQGEYSILAGSFQIKANAEILKEKLGKKGYPVDIYLIQVPDKGSWYRVVVGKYKNLSDTKKVSLRLTTEEKILPLIMKGGKYI